MARVRFGFRLGLGLLVSSPRAVAALRRRSTREFAIQSREGCRQMNAMVLKKIGAPLEWTELADRQPGAGEIRVKMAACGVCRTDLHVVEGELPDPKIPVIPGHKIVGRIDALGAGVEGLQIGETLD